MNSAANRQNFRHWAVSNPHSFEECHNQGQKKIMCWAGIIDGTVLSLHWFQDDNESPTTVNSERYRAMLEDLMWEAVKSKASRKGYFFMQDGAPPHCTNVVLQF